MPVVFVERGYRFSFYSNAGTPREPIHVHVAKRNEGDAKLWLYPDVAIAYNRRLDPRTLRWLIERVTARRQEITDAWHEHFHTG